jgi:hypothetical protein
VAAAGAQGEADPPPAPPTEEELREAEERARRQAVANATLSPASFGGAVPDRSGLWAKPVNKNQ